MERDFTTACYEKYCALIDQISDNDWNGIADWFGDRYLDLKHLLANLGILDSTAKVETYYKELLDRKNTSNAQITQVFEDVSELDTSFAGDNPSHFGYCRKQLDVYRQYIIALTQIAAAGHSGCRLSTSLSAPRIRTIMKGLSYQLQAHGLSGVLFTASTFSDLSPNYMKAYVSSYERFHPGYAEKFISILSDPDWTDQERVDIKFLTYCAPELYQSVYLKYGSLYNVDVFQRRSGGLNGYVNTTYDFEAQTIYLKNGDQKLRDDEKGPYNALFHETGHAVDNYAHNTDTHLAKSYESNGKSLQDCIVDDVRNYVSNVIDKECPGLTNEQKDQLLLSLNLSDESSFNHRGTSYELSRPLKQYRENIVSAMHTDLLGEANHASSDVYGGVTNNAIIGSFGHFPPNTSLNLTSPPPFTYWYDEDGSATKNQAVELWASFFAAQITHDEADLASLKAHFPTAYQTMEDMARQIAGK